MGARNQDWGTLGVPAYPGDTKGSSVPARMPERSSRALLAAFSAVDARPGMTPRCAPGTGAGEGESTAVRVP
jgi:hypothetical protein